MPRSLIKLSVLSKCSFLIVWAMAAFFSCGKNSPESRVHFPKNMVIDTLPFNYSPGGHVVVEVGLEGKNIH
ncbi:MAG: hypothetical protein WD426_20590 [Anditalea sp.]